MNQQQKLILTRMLSNIPTASLCSAHFMIRSAVLKLRFSSSLEAVEILAASRDNSVKFTVEKGLFTPNSKPPYLEFSGFVPVNLIAHSFSNWCGDNLPRSAQFLIAVQYPLRNALLRQVVKLVRRNGMVFEQQFGSWVGGTSGNAIGTGTMAIFITVRV